MTGDAPKEFIKTKLYIKGSKGKQKFYIAKGAKKWYPAESIMEYLITRLGQLMNFKVANGHLIRLEDGHIRFCSEYFIKKRKYQQLVHGAQIFGRMLDDPDFIEQIDQEKEEDKFIDYQFCIESIKNVYINNHTHIIKNFNEMLLHDAIIGNNDRHMYNWGIVEDISNNQAPYFSPIFDTARAFYWNESEEKILKRFKNLKIQGTSAINGYMDRSKPKLSYKEMTINHFDLIEFICSEHPEVVTCYMDKMNRINLKKVTIQLDKEFNNKLLSKERFQVVLQTIKSRFALVNKTINEKISQTYNA